MLVRWFSKRLMALAYAFIMMTSLKFSPKTRTSWEISGPRCSISAQPYRQAQLLKHVAKPSQSPLVINPLISLCCQNISQSHLSRLWSLTLRYLHWRSFCVSWTITLCTILAPALPQARKTHKRSALSSKGLRLPLLASHQTQIQWKVEGSY